jgi:hypothetical protein
VLVLIVAGAAGCADLRVKEEIFSNVAEARQAGAIAAGRVPEGVPESASDLREGYLPDGQHWGVFAFASSDIPAMRALLGPEITSGTLSCDPPGRLEWWPRLLHSPIDVDRVRSTGFRLYRQPAANLIYAVNWGQGRTYYWRGYSRE